MYVSIKTFLRFHSWYEFHVFDVFKIFLNVFA